MMSSDLAEMGQFALEREPSQGSHFIVVSQLADAFAALNFDPGSSRLETLMSE